MNGQTDPIIGLRLKQSEIGFIVDALNRNPAGAPVMAVAPLIAAIQEQVQQGLTPLPPIEDAA